MREFIKAYLLWKSATSQKLRIFDIRLAKALCQSQLLFGDLLNLRAPDWLKMIANMEQEASLPEAFADWRWDLEERVRAWWRALWRRS